MRTLDFSDGFTSVSTPTGGTTPAEDYKELTEQGSAPSNPTAGTRRLYVNTSGDFIILKSDGTSKTWATLTGTETLTNKTLTSPTINTPAVSGGSWAGGTASSSNYLQPGKASLATLTALSRSEAKVYYSSDTDMLVQDNGTNLTPVVGNWPTVAKSAAYTLTNQDYLVTGDTDSAAFTLTLPDCASNAGKVFKIKKVGTDFTTAKALTVARAGSDTIFDTAASGTSTTLNTPGEEIEIVSLGSTVWQVVSRRIPSVWTTYTPSWTASTTNPTIGNGTLTGRWKRVGDGIMLQLYILFGSTSTTGSGSYEWSIPSGLTIDTAKLGAGGSAQNHTLGIVNWHDNGTDVYGGTVAYATTTTMYNFQSTYTAATAPLKNNTNWSNGSPMTLATSDEVIAYTNTIPITGWNG